ncbi:lyase family protein [Nocardiopsis lambiniae]|uniref:Lyase family protein n=1 Tax=Nocardiopsis lambiniae TaxID=3075539 RepID=A0ABU2M732_9ACTN|nr:lyase family protein [Nocardiopsis sp. DSM 44743]MDT0328456.1 lyase family protein [Nocardiopsis sp. DSM 44743]
MTDLFWPGDERADDLFGDHAWLTAMVEVEQAWLDALAGAGTAPAGTDLSGLVGPDDLAALAGAAEGTGNPVPTLVRLLRERAHGPGAAWVHRGLTSQDVVDTALMLCARDALDRVRDDMRHQIGSLAALVRAHRDTVMAARTLTQHAVPTTFGVKAAGWLGGTLDAAEAVGRIRTPVQIGGAAGTLSAAVDLVRGRGSADPTGAVSALVATVSDRLGLAPADPWHTARRTVTALGDALVGCTDVWGRTAADVATLSRPEIAEVTEPAAAGRGGSSTMPHKRNPVLSVLVRRAAIAAPPLASTLHLAAALAVDERPDGAWHTEWATLRTLARRTVVAGSQTRELLAGLTANTERMAATAAAARTDLTAEARAIAALTGADPADDTPLGVSDVLIDRVLDRAHRHLEADS